MTGKRDRLLEGWVKGAPIRHVRSQAPEFSIPTYEGERYGAWVPDTLDLQDRAALSVRALTSLTDPDADYLIYGWAYLARNPPVIVHNATDRVQAKWMESLPLMRLMSGSNLNAQVEAKWLETMLRMQAPDGLLYWPVLDFPWFRFGTGAWHAGDTDAEYIAWPLDLGRFLGCLTNYYRLSGDGLWLETGMRLVDGLRGIMVDRGRDGFFPKAKFGLGERADPSTPVPTNLEAGVMGAGWTCEGLGKFYRATGYEPAREIGEKLSRFIMEHYYTPDGRFLPRASDLSEWIHFHSHVTALLGITEIALGTGDEERLEFARRGYEYAKLNGNVLMGYFPENLGGARHETSETCEVAQMVGLSLKLTEAGVGDYWDDVDRWMRNMLAENQLR